MSSNTPVVPLYAPVILCTVEYTKISSPAEKLLLIDTVALWHVPRSAVNPRRGSMTVAAFPSVKAKEPLLPDWILGASVTDVPVAIIVSPTE